MFIGLGTSLTNPRPVSWSGPSLSGVEIASLIEAGDYGDYFDTTDAGSVYLNTSGSVTTASAGGDEVKSIRSQVNNWLASNSKAHYWLNNALGDDVDADVTAGYSYTYNFTDFSTSGGLTFMAVMYADGSNTAGGDMDCVTLNSHGIPGFVLEPSQNTITAKFASGAEHQFAGAADGIHTYCMVYDSSADVVRYFYDGALKAEEDASAVTHELCQLLTWAAGVRSGVDNRFWKVFFVDKAIDTDTIARLDISMKDGCVNSIPTPVVTSAAASNDGTEATVNFNWRIASSTPTAGFTLYADGSPVTLSSGSVDTGDTSITFTLGSTLTGLETLTLDYDSGSGDVDSKSYSVALESFSGQSVTNVAPPQISTAEVDTPSKNVIQVTYDEAITASTPEAGFSVEEDGGAVTVSDGAVSGSTITLFLASSISNGSTVTLSYDSGTGTVTSSSTGKGAPDATDTAVTNATIDTFSLSDLEAIITSAGATDTDKHSFLQDFRTSAGLFTDTGGTTAVTTDGDTVSRANTQYDDTPSAAGQYLTGATTPIWKDGLGLTDPSGSACDLGTFNGTATYTVGETSAVLAVKVTDSDASGGATVRSRISTTSPGGNVLYFPGSDIHTFRTFYDGDALNVDVTPDANGYICFIAVPDAANSKMEFFANGTKVGENVLASVDFNNTYEAWLDNILFAGASSTLVGQMMVKKALDSDERHTVDYYFRGAV